MKQNSVIIMKLKNDVKIMTVIIESTDEVEIHLLQKSFMTNST